MRSSPARRPFRLTGQRKRILALLGEYVYLTTGHFYGLLGAHTDSSQRAERRVLRDFWRRGYIKRRPLVDYEADSIFPRYENVYWLSRSGFELAGRGRYNEEKSPRILDHDVAITNFHLALAKVCQENSFSLYWQQCGLRKTVHPDALFAVTYPGKPSDANTFYYFLEVERSRQGHYRDGESGLMKKLRLYYEYQRSPECRQEWEWFDQFRVAIVVKNDERRKHLLGFLSEAYASRMFWIATDGSDLSQKVFLTPRDHASKAYGFLGLG